MISKLNLVFDKFSQGKPFPNLVPWQDLSQGYDHLGNEYPNVIPLRLFYYFDDHEFPVNVFSIDDEFPHQSFYPIGIGFFNFDVDYIELLPPAVLQCLHNSQLKLLFYYHEGDNPSHEKSRLDDLCRQHSLSTDCYVFVSGNTAASHISNFIYFPDHELFYWRANKKHNPLPWNNAYRGKTMTLLSRTHKWWRATVVADLHRAQMLDNAYWSYNTISIDEPRDDNPIAVDYFPGLKNSITTFIQGAPYVCDSLDSDSQNRHHTLVPQHFTDSYFHVVLETMFDADQSGGTFLSEKTFKPIKHAQPFVLVAPPGSLSTLKELGYRTYDQCIINAYDAIKGNTNRWIHIRAAISALMSVDLYQWAQHCRQDAIHNQRLFVASKYDRLNTLTNKLYDFFS